MLRDNTFRTRRAFVVWLTIDGKTVWFQTCSWKEKAVGWVGNHPIWEPVEWV